MNLARHLAHPLTPFVMDDDKNIIGLGDLLEDITVRLSNLRKKHPSYYSMSLWWELEKTRLATRYGAVDCSVPVKLQRKPWRKKIAIPGRWLDCTLIAIALLLGVLTLWR